MMNSNIARLSSVQPESLLNNCDYRRVLGNQCLRKDTSSVFLSSFGTIISTTSANVAANLIGQAIKHHQPLVSSHLMIFFSLFIRKLFGRTFRILGFG